MLVGSIGGRGSTPARQAPRRAGTGRPWPVAAARRAGRAARRGAGSALAQEIALAQGFKYAANRRPAQPDVLRESRMFLAEQALEMLKNARYWFSQLTLIHALCLLNLSESKQPWDKYGAKPEAIVQHWLDVAGRERTDRTWTDRGQVPGDRHEPHPFVARRRCSACWLSRPSGRSGICGSTRAAIVGQVGSRNLSQVEQQRRHRLWIPPSAGWTALNGRAQQLVADVLLLQNLAESRRPAARARAPPAPVQPRRPAAVHHPFPGSPRARPDRRRPPCRSCPASAAWTAASSSCARIRRRADSHEWR